MAQAKLDECRIEAPFKGIITQVFVREGDLATPRAPLIKMMDPASLVVRAGLPERSAADLHKGRPAVIHLDAYPGKTFHGKIERIHPRLEWKTRTRIIEVKVTDPVELIPRLFARVSISGRIAEKAIVVPDSAIVSTPRGDKILYVVSKGTARMRKVKIGLEQGQRVQIVEGIAIGEEVVVSGNLNLKDGTKVRATKARASAHTKKKSAGDEQ